MASNRRPDRVAEAMREEIATFLSEGAKDPRIVGLVTVTGVDLTRDLRYARVYVSVLGTEEERKATFEGLASVAAHLRSVVGRALRLRLAPEISFKADESVARAARIETLLAQIKQDETARAEDAGAGESAPGDAAKGDATAGGDAAGGDAAGGDAPANPGR